MKIRNGFVTNSSSSSFIVFDVKNIRLYDFLTSLGIEFEGTERGHFHAGMTVKMNTGETMELLDELGEFMPTPEDFTSISSWIVGVLLSEVETIFPAREREEYSDFTLALMEKLDEAGIVNMDMDDVTTWDREVLAVNLAKLDEMDADVKEVSGEFNNGFEGEVEHLEYMAFKNGYHLSILSSYCDEESPEGESLEGLNIFISNIDDSIEDEAKIRKIIAKQKGNVVSEISESVDYVICNDDNFKSKTHLMANEWAIPVISEQGFLYRYTESNPFEDNEELYDELYECTWDGGYYPMFYEYGIGKVSRKKFFKM